MKETVVIKYLLITLILLLVGLTIDEIMRVSWFLKISYGILDYLLLKQAYFIFKIPAKKD